MWKQIFIHNFNILLILSLTLYSLSYYKTINYKNSFHTLNNPNENTTFIIIQNTEIDMLNYKSNNKLIISYYYIVIISWVIFSPICCVFNLIHNYSKIVQERMRGVSIINYLSYSIIIILNITFLCFFFGNNNIININELTFVIFTTIYFIVNIIFLHK